MPKVRLVTGKRNPRFRVVDTATLEEQTQPPAQPPATAKVRQTRPEPEA